MSALPENKRIIGLIIIIALLLVLPAAALAQDEDGEEPITNCNHPVVSRLADAMEVKCAELLGLLAKGYGLGQVMQAVFVLEGTGEFSQVEGLILQKQEEGIGWGQMKAARRMAGEDGDAVEMLRLKQEEGLGWGQIKKIQALIDAGASPEDAIQWMKEDLGWEEIQTKPGMQEGPPPWAAGGKNKDKTNGNGPPAWSNAGGNNKGEEEKDKD